MVVTVLGIKRDKKSPGYSVQEINGNAVSTAKEVNVANALAGKMAGVQVTRSANGSGQWVMHLYFPTSSARMTKGDTYTSKVWWDKR